MWVGKNFLYPFLISSEKKGILKEWFYISGYNSCEAEMERFFVSVSCRSINDDMSLNKIHVIAPV